MPKGRPVTHWDYVKAALRAFCQAARHGSVSRAAEQVMSSQPAVSTQVFAMEEEFGVELFERRGPRIALTHAGETRYRLAVPLVTGMNRVRDTLDLDLDHGVTHGVLAIGVGRDVAAYVLPEYLNRFREQYPAIKTDVTTGTGKQRLDWLRAHVLDLIVAAMGSRRPPSSSTRFWYPTWDSSLQRATRWPDAIPSPSKEVAAYPFIGHTSTHCGWQVVEPLMRPHGADPAVDVDGWGVITSCVEASVGIASVPDCCLPENDCVRKHSFKDPIPPRRYGAVTRRRRLLAPAASRILRIIVPDVPEVSEAP